MSSELALRAFEADALFSAALAAFQSEVSPGLNPVQAARAATVHGFSWLARPSGPGLIEVRLRHSGGADAAAEGHSVTELLGGLLGLSAGEAEAAALAPISLQQETQTAESEKKCGNRIIPEEQPSEAEGAESLAAAFSGAVVAEPAEPDPRQPLTAEQKAAAVAIVSALDAPRRRALTIAFRDAFSVPREAKAIAPLITELRHLHFCDRWTIEAAGGVAP